MNDNQRIEKIKNWILDYCKSMPIKPKCLVIGEFQVALTSSVTSTICASNGNENICSFNAYKTNKRTTRS